MGNLESKCIYAFIPPAPRQAPHRQGGRQGGTCSHVKELVLWGWGVRGISSVEEFHA